MSPSPTSKAGLRRGWRWLRDEDLLIMQCATAWAALVIIVVLILTTVTMTTACFSLCI